MPCKAEIENVPLGFRVPRGSSGWLFWTEIHISVLLVMGIPIPMSQIRRGGLHGSGFPLGMVRSACGPPLADLRRTRTGMP